MNLIESSGSVPSLDLQNLSLLDYSTEPSSEDQPSLLSSCEETSPPKSMQMERKEDITSCADVSDMRKEKSRFVTGVTFSTIRYKRMRRKQKLQHMSSSSENSSAKRRGGFLKRTSHKALLSKKQGGCVDSVTVTLSSVTIKQTRKIHRMGSSSDRTRVWRRTSSKLLLRKGHSGCTDSVTITLSPKRIERRQRKRKLHRTGSSSDSPPAKRRARVWRRTSRKLLLRKRKDWCVDSVTITLSPSTIQRLQRKRKRHHSDSSSDSPQAKRRTRVWRRTSSKLLLRKGQSGCADSVTITLSPNTITRLQRKRKFHRTSSSSDSPPAKRRGRVWRRTSHKLLLRKRQSWCVDSVTVTLSPNTIKKWQLKRKFHRTAPPARGSVECPRRNIHTFPLTLDSTAMAKRNSPQRRWAKRKSSVTRKAADLIRPFSVI